MMTEQKSGLEEFDGLMENHYGLVAKSDALSVLRAKSWESYKRIGLPQRKSELFRYLTLRKLYCNAYAPAVPKILTADSIAPYVLPECIDSVIVFVNGYYQPELSRTKGLPEKIVITSLPDAMKTYGALMTNQWVRSAKEEEDPFAALNGACHSSGAFIYLPPKVNCDVQLQILYVTDAPNELLMTTPRLHVFAGANSSLKMAATHAELAGERYSINQLTEISLEENAHVQLSQVNTPANPDIWHFDSVRALLKRDSTLKTISLTTGSASIRNDYKVVLTGENSSASLNGVWMLKDKREAHCHVLMDHRAPNCTSNQLYKGVLYDLSHSSFDGKIVVAQEAQKTNAFQLNNNLLLSDGAMADSSPNLKIFADDVKASHGATVGQLPEEELFYMRTRGLSEVEAKNILVAGFCQEVIDMLPLSSLKNMVNT